MQSNICAKTAATCLKKPRMTEMDLSEMIRNENFQAWHESTTSDYGFSNPKLYARIHNAAESGSEIDDCEQWHIENGSLSQSA